MGGEAIFVHCDVSNEKDIVKTVNRTIREFGRVDILINNAQSTLNHAHEIQNITSDEINVAYKTGPIATLLFTRECIPHMIKNGYGRIINLCSDTGIDGMETFGAYDSCKEAIRSITKVAAKELGKYQITCNVILQGAMTDAAKDIAPIAVYLASEEGNFMTGQTLYVDGGYTFGK